MTKRFERAYNALVNAFFDGTLAKGSCYACAVGNIVGDAQGGTIKRETMTFGSGKEVLLFSCTTRSNFWSKLFITTCGIRGGQLRMYNGEHPTSLQEDEIKEYMERLEGLTGYSTEEMAEIEYAFETNTQIRYENYLSSSEQEILEDQFNGLSAVVDLLLQFDGIEDEDRKYVGKFREHPKLVTV